MQQAELTLINKLGLHARAATKLSQCAARYASKVSIHCKGQVVDGKSIMAVMLLAASCGTQLVIVTEGDDELPAITELSALVNDRFGEEE